MSNQKPRTIEEQFQLLRSRGMEFSNEEEAKQCLAHISYFRLKYYWSDMRDEETEHDFKKGASFDDVIARYDFDRSLRLILFDAIEIIEVALRAKIINHLSQAKDSGLWYLDESLFERSDYYEDFVARPFPFTSTDSLATGVRNRYGSRKNVLIDFGEFKIKSLPLHPKL